MQEIKRRDTMQLHGRGPLRQRQPGLVCSPRLPAGGGFPCQAPSLNAGDPNVQRVSKNPVYSRAFARALATALKTIPGGPLVAAPTVHLIKDAGLLPTADTPLATYTGAEADFTD